jgi:glc operon protein GlcG
MKLGVRGRHSRQAGVIRSIEIGLKHSEIRSMTLSLAEANTIVAAAIAKARQLNIIVNVAVCDNQGHLISFNRMDRATTEGGRFAIGKAVASAGTGLPSGELVSRVDHPPVAGAVAEGMPVLHVRGGLPIFRSGQIEGGCGVSGAPSHHEQEEACARVGIASLGPQ